MYADLAQSKECTKEAGRRHACIIGWQLLRWQLLSTIMDFIMVDKNCPIMNRRSVDQSQRFRQVSVLLRAGPTKTRLIAGQK